MADERQNRLNNLNTWRDNLRDNIEATERQLGVDYYILSSLNVEIENLENELKETPKVVY
jgi:hypothetical protein